MEHDKKYFLQNYKCFNKDPNRVNDPLFETYDFFDKNDLAQVKYEMLRKINIDGWAVSKSCRQFGFSRSSFYEIKSEFEKYGLHGLLPSKRGPKKPHKITSEVVEFIEEKRKKKSDIRSTEIAVAIYKKFGVQIHPRSIHRYLTHHKKKR